MSPTQRRLLLLAAACSAIGLAGAGLIDPPTDAHPRPTKAPARQPSVAPPQKPKTTPPAKPESKPAAPAKPESKHGSPSKPESAPTDPHDDHGGHDDHAEKPAGDGHTESHDAHKDASTPTPAPSPVVKATQNENTDDLSPDAALKILREGNERWVNNQTEAPNTDTVRRVDTAQNGQKPFATILTCADSRLPVERIFDRGVADLFVLRVAGNVVSGEIAGSIEYGADHLKVPLLVIMGHTKCGAVAAAASGAPLEGNIGLLVEKINPAVARAKQQTSDADPAAVAAASIKENVWQSMFDLLRTSGEVRRLVKDGKLRVVGAVCDVSTGRVEWIGQHPWQDALVDAFDARNVPNRTETAGAEQH